MSVDLSGLRRDITDHARALAQAAADDVAQTVDAATPYRTGFLRASRTGPELVETTDQHVLMRLGYEAPYASFTDTGTQGPYRIEARNAKVLRFIGRDGEPVYRRFVIHPGVRGTQWFDAPMQDRWDAALERAAG